MRGAARDDGPVTVVVTWNIRPGRERDFEAWRHEIAAAALEFPGHMGIDVIRPKGGSNEYGVIFRFDTEEHLRAWQSSDIRRDLLKKSEPLRESEPAYRRESGLEFWFESPGSPPPRWKMAVVTVLGVWPVSILIPWLLSPLIAGFPLPLKALLVSVGIVILLTWAVMPILVRILRPWLHRGT